jgi:hypothetical protein
MVHCAITNADRSTVFMACQMGKFLLWQIFPAMNGVDAVKVE